MGNHATKLLAAATDDVGPGESWPVAVLSGAVSASLLSAGAWFALERLTGRAEVALHEWVALHASVGLLGGVLASALIGFGRGLDPALREPGLRRAAAARLSAVGAFAVCLCASFSLRPSALQALALALGLALGAGLCTLVSLRIAGSLSRPLPRLDPLRVAPWVALLLVPLHDSIACDSLGEAWRVMLGR